MAVIRIVFALLVLALSARTGFAADQIELIVTYNAPPIYLPRTSFWKYALPPIQASSGNEELDQAYHAYLLDDQLGSRAHLYRALQELAKQDNQGLTLRAVSLQCLLNTGTVPDDSLLMRNRSDSVAEEKSAPLEERLLSARWKKQGSGTIHRSLLPWIELFDAYQRYRHGDRQDAVGAWNRLAHSPTSGPVLSGLALLGMAQVGGEILTETKGASPAPAEAALDAAHKAVDAFTSAKKDLGVSQAHMLAAEIDYVVGQPDAAYKELEKANSLFEKANDQDGWTDVNLIGGLGLTRAGKTEDGQSAVLAAEEGLGKLRIPPDQIAKLATFAHRMPSLKGDPDPRPIAEKLADAREFHRWTSATDPMLDLISLRILTKFLRESGNLGDADFYEALRADLGARYHAMLPLSVRVGRAALADYDFLLQTKELEQQGPAIVPFGFSRWIDVYLAAKKGYRDEALKDIPGVSVADAEKGFALFSNELKKLAAQADERNHGFQEHMAAGDRHAAAESLVNTYGVLQVILDFLNTFDPVTEFDRGTETENVDAMEAGKRRYKIQAKVAFDYRVEVPHLTKLEMEENKLYLNLTRFVLAAAIMEDERYLRKSVQTLLDFYDHYRSAISPPDLLDLPFSFQASRGNLLDTSFPTQEKKRNELIKRAMNDLRQQYREKLIQETISTDPNAPNVGHDSDRRASDDNESLAFFQKNWDKDSTESKAGSTNVTRQEQNGQMVVNIEHAYTAAFKLKEDSDYSKLPPAGPGIDLQDRARVVRACRALGQLPINHVRFDKILESMSLEQTGSQMMGAYLGMTPEQLAQQGALYNALIGAGQMALSAQKTGDFLSLPGAHPFDYWKKLLQSDSDARAFAFLFTQISEPDSPQDDQQKEQAAELGRNLVASLSRIEQSENEPAGGSLDAVHSTMHVAAIAQTLRYRPFLLLLLGDRSAAEAAAKKASAKQATQKVPASMDRQAIDDRLGLALFSLAGGDYQRAITELKPLPEAARSEDTTEVFQMEYLLAMCYRRTGDRASETTALLSAIDDLDRLRRSLRTRNQALAVQALRQMIYEESLDSLFAQRRYREMAGVMRHYKRSNQLPISALGTTATDSQLDLLVDNTVMLYDVLSRDDVWKVSDASSVTVLMQLVKAKTEDPAEARQNTLQTLNHIADVLVDELQPATQSPSKPVGAVTPSAQELTIFYFVGKRGLYRVTVTPAGQATARYLPVPESEIAEVCGRFRSAIEERKDVVTASARLYEILLGDLPEFNTSSRLNLSPDGTLNFIPFQALKKSVNDPYLIEDHILNYISGTPTPPATAAGAGNRILVVGNPDETLPAAEAEATHIAHSAGLEAGEPLLRGQATIGNLRTRLAGVDFVHLATHARANPLAPNFAYLQLSNNERLYSLNLGGLRFSGKHVFLSACETRIGQNIPGEDIYGIADSFLADGAASVVSTLWRVESNSAALFAQRYYELLVQTRNAAAAVAMTEREFIHGKWFVEQGGTPKTLDAPLYWAGFNHLGPDLVDR